MHDIWHGVIAEIKLVKAHADSFYNTYSLNSDALKLGDWFRAIMALVFINPTMHDKVTGRTRTGFTEAYAQSLRADCDVDL